MTSPIPHGTNAGYQRGCPCDACGEAHRLAKRAYYERIGPDPARMTAERSAALVERSKRLQQETAANATRARSRWSSEDLAVALDYRHTAADAAVILGRSLSAVRHIRHKHGARPEVLPYRPRPRTDQT